MTFVTTFLLSARISAVPIGRILLKIQAFMKICQLDLNLLKTG
jgi:hypothetical protein